MKHVVYDFENTCHGGSLGYILQTVRGRKLSDTYHSHDFYEWIIVADGNCTQIINETRFFCEKCSLTLLCPGDSHKFTEQSSDAVVLALSVRKNETDLLCKAFCIYEKLQFMHTLLTPAQLRGLLEFSGAATQSEHKLLLANLLKLYTDSQKHPNDIPATLRSAICEMSKPENLIGGTEKFTVISQYSRSHLERLMKKHYGITVHGFILNARLEAAYNGLVLTHTNPCELSESLGFSSFSHFNKVFKERFGITPASLRKNHGVWTT